VISGFRREVDENSALLRYYAGSSGNFLPTFRDNLSGPKVFPEMSVRNHHYLLRNDPEERSSLLVVLMATGKCLVMYIT
jgi:hypothetical protein